MNQPKALVAVAVVFVLGLGTGCTARSDDGKPGAEGGTLPAPGTNSTNEESPVEHSQPKCAFAGLDPRTENMKVTLNFTNSLGEVNDLEATYGLFDGEGGMRFYTGTAGYLDGLFLTFPSADEKFALAIRTRDTLPAKINRSTIACKVLAIKEGFDLGGYVRASVSDTCKVVGGSSGGPKIEATVTSPYRNTTRVQTWWALQGPGPVRFGTDTEVVDLVSAHETFKIAPKFGLIQKPAWVPSGKVTCRVLGFWDQGH